MTIRQLAIGAALALAVTPWAAAAQRDASEIGNPHGANLGEVGVGLRAGLAGFTGGLSNFTNTGASFGVQATSRPNDRFGFEVDFDASRNGIDDTRLPASGSVARNGLQGLAKLYVPFGRAQPYVGAGIGASFINPNDPAENSGLYEKDLVAEIPVAVGLEYPLGPVNAGARVTYDLMFGESFANDASPGTNPNGSLVSGTVTLGAVF